MQDRDRYAQILGIREPWHVERVDLKVTEDEVHVHLVHDEGLSWPRPECGKKGLPTFCQAVFTVVSQ